MVMRTTICGIRHTEPGVAISRIPRIARRPRPVRSTRSAPGGLLEKRAVRLRRPLIVLGPVPHVLLSHVGIPLRLVLSQSHIVHLGDPVGSKVRIRHAPVVVVAVGLRAVDAAELDALEGGAAAAALGGSGGEPLGVVVHLGGFGHGGGGGEEVVLGDEEADSVGEPFFLAHGALVGVVSGVEEAVAGEVHGDDG